MLSPPQLQALYTEFKLDLPAINGQKGTWELPLSATLVVDQQGQIIYIFADEDYKVRAPMDEVLRALD
jgi:hypothetical protein